MEEKIVGEKKGSSLFSDISFTLILVSTASLSPVFVYIALALDLPPHSGSPTTLDHASLERAILDWPVRS